MKTYAPKGLHGAQLRGLLSDMGATPAQAAKYLQVSERTVWRWLSDESAPFAVLAALWHETPEGRHVTALDVGNEVQIYAGLARSAEDLCNTKTAQLTRLVAISDTGAANDALLVGPVAAGGVERFEQCIYKPKRKPPAPPVAEFDEVVKPGAKG